MGSPHRRGGAVFGLARRAFSGAPIGLTTAKISVVVEIKHGWCRSGIFHPAFQSGGEKEAGIACCQRLMEKE